MKYSKYIILLLLCISIFSSLNYTSFKSFIDYPSQTPKVLVQSTQQTLPDIARFGCGAHIGNPNVELDPLNEIVQVPLSLIYEPLVDFDETKQEVVPVLAYQWVVTNDSKHWTFYLRDNIIFHDGSKFNASAIEFALERTRGVENQSTPLDSIEIINEFQVTFHFYESYAPFLIREAQMFMIPSPNSFEGKNLTTPIGTGPYTFDQDKSNLTFLHFDRFDQYHGGLAPFKEIHYYFYPDSATLEADIQSNKLDYIDNRGSLDPSDTHWTQSEIFSRPIMQLGWFNHRNPLLTNRNVRLAINYGINKVALVQDAPHLNLTPLRSIIPPGMFGYDSSVVGYPYNPDLANSLLDGAGYTRDENGTRFSLTIVHPGPLSGVLSENIQDLGIEYNIVNDTSESHDEWFRQRAKGDFDLTFSYIIDFDPRYTYSLLHSTGAKNVGAFVNPALDSFTIMGRSTPVRQEREYYYSLVQNVTQEESPYLLLYSRGYKYWQAKDLAPYFHLSGSYRFNFNYTNPMFDSSLSPFPQYKIHESSSSPPKTVSNVEVKDQAIYFPITDVIITNPANESIITTVKMSHNLKDFLPSANAFGKYFTVEINKLDTFYRFRCYYDSSEVKGPSTTNLAMYKYQETTGSWKLLPTIIANSSLHYIEVVLESEFNLLRLCEVLRQVTYKLIPFITILMLPIIIIILFIMVRNQQMAKYVRRVYK
ncbi:MAG: ABC transporter substrate-binding protein [Promethearchaeota archaeon]